MTPEEETELKRRQRMRNLVLGAVLLFMVVLLCDQPAKNKEKDARGRKPKKIPDSKGGV